MISYAASSPAAAGTTGGLLQMLLTMIVIFGFMYFAVIRPQKKRDNELRNMINSIKPGDIVDTNAGLVGKVVRTSENEVVIEAQPSGVRLSLRKFAIINVQKTDDNTKVSTSDIGKIVKEDEDYIYEEVSDDEVGEDLEYIEVDKDK